MNIKVGDAIYVAIRIGPTLYWRRAVVTKFRPGSIETIVLFEFTTGNQFGQRWLSEVRPVSPLVLLAEIAP